MLGRERRGRGRGSRVRVLFLGGAREEGVRSRTTLGVSQLSEARADAGINVGRKIHIYIYREARSRRGRVYSFGCFDRTNVALRQRRD